MLPKKYIGVDAINIDLIMHVFSDDEKVHFFSKKGGKVKYPKPRIYAFTKGDAREIFERNNIPAEYQKMFMVVNNI